MKGEDFSTHSVLRTLALIAVMTALASLSPNLRAQSSALNYRTERDIQYAEVDQSKLKLDLYLPIAAKQEPLLVWIHGGAWREGSKDSPPILGLTSAGYAIASVDYRLSPVAHFPAQIHDIKAAIRYLRAHAQQYGYDARRIAILGASAGGHLAALAGVSAGNAQLEGSVGENTAESSAVQAIVSFFGASDLTSILAQSRAETVGFRAAALKLLLGGTPDEEAALARLASPVFHVDEHDPPLLLLHDTEDPQMPVQQAYELVAAYKAHGLDAQLIIVPHAGHGGAQFFDDQRMKRVRAFLDDALSWRANRHGRE